MVTVSKEDTKVLNECLATIRDVTRKYYVNSDFNEDIEYRIVTDTNSDHDVIYARGRSFQIDKK